MLNCFFIVKPAFYITGLESAKQKSAKIEKNCKKIQVKIHNATQAVSCTAAEQPNNERRNMKHFNHLTTATCRLFIISREETRYIYLHKAFKKFPKNQKTSLKMFYSKITFICIF
jgi:hypothetical protein